MHVTAFKDVWRTAQFLVSRLIIDTQQCLVFLLTVIVLRAGGALVDRGRRAELQIVMVAAEDVVRVAEAVYIAGG